MSSKWCRPEKKQITNKNHTDEHFLLEQIVYFHQKMKQEKSKGILKIKKKKGKRGK